MIIHLLIHLIQHFMYDAHLSLAVKQTHNYITSDKLSKVVSSDPCLLVSIPWESPPTLYSGWSV